MIKLKELLLESPEIKTLKANKIPLSDEERNIVMNAKATWSFGKDGSPSPAVWKSKVKNKIYYVSNTHRCYSAKSNLKAAINAFFKIVEPSS